MAAQHTQRKWTITREQLQDYKGKNAQNVYVDGMHVGSYEGEVDLTNDIEQRARLIAAAPKLLGALKHNNRQLKEMLSYTKRWSPDDIRLTAMQMEIESNEALLKSLVQS